MIRNTNLHRSWILSDLGTASHTELMICQLLACTLNLKSMKLKNKTCASGKWGHSRIQLIRWLSNELTHKLKAHGKHSVKTSHYHHHDQHHCSLALGPRQWAKSDLLFPTLDA